MAQAEMVTVRMSRGHMDTPWGFDVGPQLTITNVTGGSLADRAGLLNGDILVELEGHQNLNVELAKQLLAKTEHRVELVVHRTGGNVSHRVWQPSVTENTEYNKFQHSVHNVASTDTQKAQPPNVPLKVSLEHQNPESIPIPGFNVAAQPFGDHQEVKHLQYNSPMPLYSPQSAAEQYLQQTGGLFGTDPNLNKQKEVPSYLRSETLRLIQESERDGGGLTRPARLAAVNREEIRSNTEAISGTPICFICGRNIVGVMCRAYDRTMHGECFQCSTCGSSLKNQGHHFINDKFYCDIHGRQLQGGGGGSVGRRDEIHLSTAHRPQMAPSPNRDTLRAPYQPEVMARRPLSISPTPWKTQSPISPSNRGVPPAATHYGQELNELKREIYRSSMTAGNKSEKQHHQHLHTLSRARLLPLEIRKVTSPRRHPSKQHWPPAAQEIKKYWQYGRLLAAASEYSVVGEADGAPVSLSEFIKRNEEEQRRPPSPKRYLLRGEQQPIKHLENGKGTDSDATMARGYHSLPHDTSYRNPEYLGCSEQQKRFSDQEEAYRTEEESFNGESSGRILDSGYSSHYSTDNVEHQKQQQDNESSPGSLILIHEETGYEKMDSVSRKREGRWFGEAKLDVNDNNIVAVVSVADRDYNPDLTKHPETKEYDSWELSVAIESPDGISRYDDIANADLGTVEEEEELIAETEEKFVVDIEEVRYPQDISVENVIYTGNICGTEQRQEFDQAAPKKENVDVAHFEKQGKEDRMKSDKVSKNSHVLEEHDKRIAIESIARYQQELREPEKELSHMLDNAIDFLRNLDNMEDKMTNENGRPHIKKVEKLDKKKSKSLDGETLENSAKIRQNPNDDYYRESHMHIITPSDIIVKMLHETALERSSATAANKPASLSGNNTDTSTTKSTRNEPTKKDSNSLRTPSEVIIESIKEAESRDSNRNSYMKPYEQQIRQSDELARGRGVLHTQGGRIPYCEECKQEIRGAYVLANGLAYCPDHFICANKSCGRKLLDIGFVEEKGRKYCEHCFETQIAPRCAKCSQPITADCLNALQKQWHPHCFVCTHCHKPFGNSAFFLEQGQPYCEADWNALFTTKCVSCHYPIEAGDRWVEALGAAFHSNCFNCTSCNVNLEGESFYARNGAPYCKLHA